MRLSFEQAFAPLQDRSVMSGEGRSNPPGDRPRMAEALASLNEGQRESADPLYDGWKRRQRAPDPANPPGRPGEAPSPTPNFRGKDAITAPGETIDITLDTLEGTPDQTPAAETTSDAPVSIGSLADGLPTQDELVADDLPTQDELVVGDLPAEDVLIEVTEDDGVPPASPRTSVQTDTVRVRVIRYQPFPRWAIVLAAALLVFAVSLVALRASLPREGSRASRAVLASEVGTTLPISNADRPAFPAPSSVVASAPPALAAPAISGARPPSGEDAELASPLPSPRGESGAAPMLPSDRTPIAVSALPQEGKSPASPPRRRPGSRDFFRDPGF